MQVSVHHRLAALDNAGLCTAMWRAHSLDIEEADGFVACSGPAPRFYPNLVTVDPCINPEVQARQICKRAGDTPGPYVVKDSYNLLGLGRLGFEVLFRASWIRRAPAETGHDLHLDWRPVTNPREDLAAWETAWGQRANESRIFLPAFLSSPGVTVLAGRTEGRIVAGCIMTATGQVAGISNVFGDATEVIQAAASAFQDRDLVGYEQGEALAAALAAGFEIVGGLTVWRGHLG